MRKSLWIILAVLLVAFGAPAAHADTVTDGILNFTLISGGPAPTAGSFVFDNSTGLFLSYTVSWDGAVYNFAPPANIVGFAVATQTVGGFCGVGPAGAPGCTPALPGSFSLPFDSLQPSSGTFTDPTVFAFGSFTVTQTVITTPEPSSVALMLLGIGIVFLMRKRIGQGLPQAS
jgi:hypothetical protein